MVKNRVGVKSVDRTCINCHETFDTKRGLQMHQKNKIRVGCYRAGIARKISGVKAARAFHFEKCSAKGRVLSQNPNSLASSLRRGRNITASEKQIYLNVYSYFSKNCSSRREVNISFNWGQNLA